jgi:hypothetical protein
LVSSFFPTIADSTLVQAVIISRQYHTSLRDSMHSSLLRNHSLYYWQGSLFWNSPG